MIMKIDKPKLRDHLNTCETKSLDHIVEDVDGTKRLTIHYFLGTNVQLQVKEGNTWKAQIMYDYGPARNIGEVDAMPYRVHSGAYHKLNTFLAPRGQLDAFFTAYNIILAVRKQEEKMRDAKRGPCPDI